MEDLTAEEQDSGDGRSNDLVLSCPFFRNELGEEAQPRVSLSKMGTLNTKVMRKFKQKVILERIGDGRGIINSVRGPVLELVDQGALYYKQYFEKHGKYPERPICKGKVSIACKCFDTEY